MVFTSIVYVKFSLVVLVILVLCRPWATPTADFAGKRAFLWVLESVVSVSTGYSQRDRLRLCVTHQANRGFPDTESR
jgi:hypothetical protein